MALSFSRASRIRRAAEKGRYAPESAAQSDDSPRRDAPVNS